MEKYYGNYLGLVVNDQDPEGRDRVQIYVPGVTNTIYDNWNNNNKNKSIGIDIGSTFTLNEEILKKLRNVLPWAEKATPLIGPGTAMYHQEGRGASSAPTERKPPSDNSTKSHSDVTTNNSIPFEIDGYPTTGLDPIVKNLLPSFKESFPKSTITSTVRTYNKTTKQVIGADGKEVTGSSADSLHNAEKDKNGNYTKLSRAIDIDMPSLPQEQERVVQWWMQNGATEIGWEGDHIHVGFTRDNDKNVFWRDSSGTIRTDLKGSPPWFENIGEQFKKGQIPSLNNYVYTASPPTAAKNGEANVSTETDSVSPSEGTPQGTRSTTRTLSKVWLFFYGGDIQKPVFFAYSLPPNETYAHNNIPENNPQTSNGGVNENVEVVLPAPSEEDAEGDARMAVVYEIVKSDSAFNDDPANQEKVKLIENNQTDSSFTYYYNGKIYYVDKNSNVTIK